LQALRAHRTLQPASLPATTYSAQLNSIWDQATAQDTAVELSPKP